MMKAQRKMRKQSRCRLGDSLNQDLSVKHVIILVPLWYCYSPLTYKNMYIQIFRLIDIFDISPITNTITITVWTNNMERVLYHDLFANFAI